MVGAENSSYVNGCHILDTAYMLNKLHCTTPVAPIEPRTGMYQHGTKYRTSLTRDIEY